MFAIYHPSNLHSHHQPRYCQQKVNREAYYSPALQNMVAELKRHQYSQHLAKVQADPSKLERLVRQERVREIEVQRQRVAREQAYLERLIRAHAEDFPEDLFSHRQANPEQRFRDSPYFRPFQRTPAAKETCTEAAKKPSTQANAASSEEARRAQREQQFLDALAAHPLFRIVESLNAASANAASTTKAESKTAPSTKAESSKTASSSNAESSKTAQARPSTFSTSTSIPVRIPVRIHPSTSRRPTSILAPVDAAARITRFFRTTLARKHSLSVLAKLRKLRSIENRILSLRSQRPTSHELTFSAEYGERVLPITQANKDFLAREEAAMHVLDELDGVQSEGSDLVRERRKSVVRLVQEVLDGLDIVKGKRWQEFSDIESGSGSGGESDSDGEENEDNEAFGIDGLFREQVQTVADVPATPTETALFDDLVDEARRQLSPEPDNHVTAHDFHPSPEAGSQVVDIPIASEESTPTSASATQETLEDVHPAELSQTTTAATQESPSPVNITPADEPETGSHDAVFPPIEQDVPTFHDEETKAGVPATDHQNPDIADAHTESLEEANDNLPEDDEFVVIDA